MKIGFLHTAETHIPLFQSLVRDFSAEVEVAHRVDAPLLERSINYGVDESVKIQLLGHFEALAAEGCEAIACTCSTLGGAAEGMIAGSVQVERIDRAAADYLATCGHVLVIAAIEAAAQATVALLQSSASNAGAQGSWLVALVPGAWHDFERGDLDKYEQKVADFANQFSDEYDALFLSQASMLGAAKHCQHRNVVSSPVMGVQKLLEGLASATPP